MRVARRAGIVCVAMDDDDEHGSARVSCAVEIELRLEGSVPAGVVCGPGGTTRPFSGWVGLMSAVDAVVAADGSEPGAMTGEVHR